MVVSESKFCRNKITGNKDIFVLSLGKIYGLLIQDFCKFSDRVSQLDQLPHLLYSDFCDISCVLWRLLVEKSKLSGKFPSHDVVTASSYSSSKVHQTWQHAPVWSHRASGASWKPLHECVAVGCFQKSRGEKYGWSIHQSIMKSSAVMTWDIGDFCSKCNRCSFSF